MKKIGLYMLGLLTAFGLAACDDSSDLGIQQQNPQEAIMEANGLTVAWQSPIQGNTLSLPAYKDQAIPVISTVETKDLPAGATIDYEMQIASNADFSDAQTVAVENGAVLESDWDNAFKAIYHKDPAARVNYIRFAAYVIDGSQVSRLGGDDFWYGAKQLTVTPIDLQLPVEGTYYLYAGGEYIKMNHSAQHQYDDPNFSLIVEVSAAQAQAGYKWQIANEGYSKVYGVSETGDPADFSGNLVLDGAQGVINAAGTYKIEVNMLDLTYHISYAFQTLNTPGPANGWSFDNNMLLTTNDYITYFGYVYIQQEFKLAAGSWDVNWGMGGTEGTLGAGGANIKVPSDGLYYVVANLNELTYSLTKIETIGLIGGFNGWGGQVNLTPSADYKTWTGDVTFTEETEWKFRMNDNWDYNLGGAIDNLVGGGDNLKSAAGSYTVTLDLGKLPYSCTLTSK
ncbi:MAG: SusF/SusE family outer membrane protein [Lepagella sp.]